MGFHCLVPNLQNPNRSKINNYHKTEQEGGGEKSQVDLEG